MTAQTITLREYQKFTNTTAVYPDAGKNNIPALMYAGLGLASEAGECANYIKKVYRDGDTPELRQKIADELGDILYYASHTAEILGLDIQELLEKNQKKLLSRKERGVLKGSGDNR